VEPQFTITDSGLWMGNGKAIIRHVGGTRFAKPRVYTDAELLRGCAEHFCPTPVGTLLWVAERWQKVCGTFEEYAIYGDGSYRSYTPQTGYVSALQRCGEFSHARLKPASHMPQWASRLWFEVTAVRIEREGDKWEWVYTLNRVEAER